VEKLNPSGLSFFFLQISVSVQSAGSELAGAVGLECDRAVRIRPE